METAVLYASMEPGAPRSQSSEEWSSEDEDSPTVTSRDKMLGNLRAEAHMVLAHHNNSCAHDMPDGNHDHDEDGGGGGSLEDPEKERMLQLLRTFSSPVDPSSISSTRIESLTSLPAGVMDAAAQAQGGSRIHSCANSNSNIHSCLNSTHALSGVGQTRMASGLYLGSSASFATSVNLNLTPLPTRKLSYQPGHPVSETGTDLLNLCRICQLPGDGEGYYASRSPSKDILFSPCRCSGSLKYVHYSCLLKWLEISTRKTKRPPMCELCHFMYIRHKRFKFHNWRLPRVSRRDKCLHIIFLLTLLFMVASAVATVLCFLSDNGQISQTKSQLSLEEVVTLICGVLFFVSFFLAMTVEIKARHTVYRLFLKFIMYNTEWQIEPYDKAKDPNCPKPYLYV